MTIKAMIMAAGVGSRLDPLTQDVPKPLVPIANRPIMDLLLEKLLSIGIKDVIANTHYKAQQIIDRYGKNDSGLHFEYIHEQELSGTAGGVKKCQYFFDKDEDFLVLSADGLSNVDLNAAIEAHKNSGAIASLGIKQIELEDIPNFGVVVTDESGFITEFQEKPAIKDAKSDYINTGIYIFKYDLFNYIPENQFYDFAKNVFPDLLSKGQKINTFKVDEYWSDIGTIDQYAQSTLDLFSGKFQMKHSKITETDDGLYIKGLGTYVAPSAVLKGCNTIGDKCIIGKNTLLENCIIWNNVEIQDGVSLKNCIIASNCEIKMDMVSQVIGPNEIVSHGVFN